MSIMPEFIFQTSILRGLSAFKRDSKLVDQLFKNLDQESQDLIRLFLRTKTINVTLNYPREGLKLPSIVILLKTEQESQAYLGDSKGFETAPEDFSYDSGTEGTIGGAASIGGLGGMGKLIFGPITASTATSNTVSIGNYDFTPNAFAGGSHQVRVTMGRGSGQVRDVLHNDYDSITVTKNWATVPDSTSIFEVRRVKDEVVGQPSALYDEQNVNTKIERKGSRYETKYHVQVITERQESTIVLNTIVKAILTNYRLFLEQQGIMNMKLSATDFVPRNEHIPDIAYMRAMDVTFDNEFDIYVEPSDLAQSATLKLYDYDNLAHETTVDLTRDAIEIQ